MHKEELRKLLDEGQELGWLWKGTEYWLLPVWNKEGNEPFIEPAKVMLAVNRNGIRSVAREYDSLDAVISDGYDLETMCDDSNPTFSY